MASIKFPITVFDPSPALAKAATLYERYFRTATAVPFVQEVCESAYWDWKDAIEAVVSGGVVVPETMAYSPRPPGVTDEEIAEVGDALARGYWPVHCEEALK